jgi:hypothetical protein
MSGRQGRKPGRTRASLGTYLRLLRQLSYLLPWPDEGPLRWHLSPMTTNTWTTLSNLLFGIVPQPSVPWRVKMAELPV